MARNHDCVMERTNTRPTLRGLAKGRTLKLDFVVKKRQDNKISFNLGYLFLLYVDTKTVKML